MSTLKLDRARTRFRKAMAIAPQERFLLMLWAVEALRSGRPDIARQFIRFTPEQAKQAVGDTHAIFPWELETLAIQSLTIPREVINRIYRCEDFATAANFSGMLRHLEDQEFGATPKAKKVDIFVEMHRIGQRQFPWQRGGPNLADFYRPLHLYGQGRCAKYFEATHGLTINDFSLIGFALFAMFSTRPYAIRPPNLSELELAPATIEAALKLLSLPLAKAGVAQRKLLQEARAAAWPIAYQPSVLRQFPVLSLGDRPERLAAPVPLLVLQRVTFGLYYDLLGEGGDLRNEIAGRFEQYSADVTSAMMPGFKVEREYRYAGKRKGVGYNSPDILIEDGGELAIVFECKATKLTISAKFSDDPAADAKERYAEIGRGVFQLWRFFAHCRLGLTDRTLTDGTAGLVLTLDTWLVMAMSLQEHVLEVASAMADADPDISAADRRPIAFAAIQDFEQLLSQSDEAGVRAALAAAHQDRFRGWVLPRVDKELHGTSRKRKRYPFRPDAILPWWTKFDGGKDDDEDEAA